MKRFLVFILHLFSITSILGQHTEQAHPSIGRNSFYAELGGPGILFSANLDRRFTKSRLGWGGRAGLGFVTSSRDHYNAAAGYYEYRQATVVTLPLQGNYIFGKGTNPHTFEVGAGLTFLSKRVDLFEYRNASRSLVLGTFSFMYRRQPVDGGFTWRIGFVPIIGGGYIQSSAGAGVGYNF